MKFLSIKTIVFYINMENRIAVGPEFMLFLLLFGTAFTMMMGGPHIQNTVLW